jgi:hypothetical protein
MKNVIYSIFVLLCFVICMSLYTSILEAWIVQIQCQAPIQSGIMFYVFSFYALILGYQCQVPMLFVITYYPIFFYIKMYFKSLFLFDQSICTYLYIFTLCHQYLVCCFMQVQSHGSCWGYPSATHTHTCKHACPPKMEAACSSRKFQPLVVSQPRDHNLDSHHHDNLKTYSCNAWYWLLWLMDFVMIIVVAGILLFFTFVVFVM